MQEVMSRIELGSVLGKTFGKVHYRLISRVSEAGVALAKTIPGFEQFMISSQRRGLTYSVFKGKKNIGVDDLGFPITGEVIRIVPVIIGSKKAGLIQTILGAVLVIASIWMPGLSIAASNMMFAAGASITLGGVVQMISPQATGLASKQSSDNRASYAFGGVTNTAAQGYPVPLLYGRRRIGGAIISAGIYVEDQQ
ncbi:TPA: tail assembly protein [Escherichia coli]|uniref:tail assembly protein n=1 Tax=Escherichia coli TaxID=562 RepID=UPI0015FD7D6F|nr:tail assembly protein [Escherichia coli]EFO3050450.1 tail assembly protein [Escherichia coli O32]EEZ4445711.1 tail assembly protein [Escherichia coli]EFN7884183.1 tail assembly protein [Escherichia coli]EFN7922311.1 tail assembly protein [Escherichia coli]EGS1826919.1 tail assembly protein [Escherichia coli]